MSLPAGIRGVLLDVEGTTTPVSFVYETLFPYARARLEAALGSSSENPEIERARALLRDEHAAASSNEDVPPFGNGAPFAAYLMDHDRKSTGLKALQGILWEDGYRDGELRAPVFDDVPPAFAAWRRHGIRIRIFSSGSVLAQKLLFTHTDHGDLTDSIEGYHDTTTGPKTVPESYRTIARAFALAPPGVLFLSDVPAELDAAREAGMHTGLLERPGNRPVAAASHPAFADFLPLLPRPR